MIMAVLKYDDADYDDGGDYHDDDNDGDHYYYFNKTRRKQKHEWVSNISEAVR